MFEISNRNQSHSINNYNPFREMDRLQRDFLRDPFDSFFGSQDLDLIKTDITDNGDHYELEADLPGFNKEDIKLELRGDNLIISAERHSNAEEKNKDGRVVRMERSYGSYQRSFNVSEIDTNHIRAAYDNGVLKLQLPKLQTQLPESRVLQID